jgi:hypothetical protein
MSKETKHKLLELISIIEEYEKYRLTFDTKELIDIRERLSLCLFYLSDFISEKIAAYDAADYNRKREYAASEEKYRAEIDPTTDKKYTQGAASNRARVDNKEADNLCSDARRQKEKVNVIVSSSYQVLHAIAARINHIEK